jgi:hypothetical protein
VPGGWEKALGDLAKIYGWPPSELWAMEVDGWEVEFWIDRHNESKHHG